MVGCDGCSRDPFIAPDGTLLENRLWGGDGASFAWVKTFGPTAFPDPAVIQNDAVGKTSQGFWRYITNALRADSVEIEVDVLGDIGSEAIQYDIGIVLRNTSADSGGFGGYTIFWSAFGNGAGAADAFITIDRPGANLLFEDDVPVPTPGTHTLGVAALAGGAINVYVDGVLTATAVDPAPLPPGNAGLSFGWAGTAPSRVWITTFAEGLHQRDSASVTIQRADVALSPKGLGTSGGLVDFSGQPVITQVQLQVSVDSEGVSLPNRDVTLSVSAIDLSGAGADGPYGHVHTGVGGIQKPAGTLSPTEVNTGSDRVSTVTYRTGPVSGPVVLRAESQGAKAKVDTVQVGVLGLTPLTGRNSYKLIGKTSIHPVNYWGVPAMVTKLNRLADNFYAAFNRPLYYNDLSLPLGGLFDVDTNWACCHDEHRAGRDLDLRTDGDTLNGGLTPGQRIFVWDDWELLGGEVYDERLKRDRVTPNLKNPHYHLRDQRRQ